MKQSLFRTIRRKLLLRRQGSEGRVSEGKLVRYLTYALGEILLIVLGILFALKINDWNEDRKAQAEFDEYILQLKEDVRTAIANVEFSKSVLERFKKNGEYVLTFLELSDYGTEELTAFENGLSALPSVNLPQIYVGMLGQLINGNIEIIQRDNELAQKALELESNVERYLDNIQRNSNRIELIAANHLSILLGIGNSVFEVPSKYKVPSKYNLEFLKTSDEFVNAIYTLQTYKMRILNFDDSIAEHLQDFLTVLEEYDKR